MITAQEKQTRKAYKVLAKTWSSLHNDTTFWKKYYQTFQKYLPSGKIVDIGCGAGRDARFFVRAGYDYLGIDASSAMLREAKKFAPRARFERMDMTKLEFPPQSFDGFWAYASFLHIPKKDIGGVLKRIRRILKPGGVGSIALKEGDKETMVPGPELGTERFFSYYRADEFATILKKHGFKLLKQLREVKSSQKGMAKTPWLIYFVTSHVHH